MTKNYTPEPQGQPYDQAGAQDFTDQTQVNPNEFQTTSYDNAGFDQAGEPAQVPATTNSSEVDHAVAPEKTQNERAKVKGSAAGSTWVALIIGALLLILLLVFILQNQQSVKLQLFAWEMNFPIGVGMLIAAIVGALIMALVGGVRMLQLRRQVTHRRK